METHLLRTFVAVARGGSFSRAARDLGYTQSAISQHIAALEQDLGTTLLTRRPVAPTRAGERLLEHAGPLLTRLDAARADLARLTAAPTGRVALGLTPLSLTADVAATVRRGTEVRVLGREDVLTELAAGELDLGLVDGMTAPSDPLPLPDTGPLTTTVVGERPLAVAVPAGHPMAGRAVRLAELADAGWIDAPDTAIPLARLRKSASTGGFRGRLRYTGTDVRGLLGLVAAGQGLALLPADVLTGVSTLSLSSPRVVHRTELVHGDPGEGAALAAALTGQRP
ncbi:LysR family transcriptional regulator [Amycolatopsis roodepoortensis]|uniref:DNA-binding transcriptional LysR family regulator n=1 Tax=Amycolatopsis roodepoortensis TaxID=700274 RepID=A0ABR9LKB4_9PSEU|nr:LysR family transcriptional regulator [Amycolatopsis roodepoortensis]MBE1581121.1 DNA-binding transcriptional LysR family regulator [Amycolatopsis roodepoortensis]